MSHPDPLFDPDNAYDDDDMSLVGDEEDSNFDDFNESMDGDHDSAMTSAGFGTDEDYGYYGEENDFYYGDDF